MLVISGPGELAVSGLEQIDAELKGQGHGAYQVAIEWQLLDEKGLLSSIGQYASFGGLIAASRDRNTKASDRSTKASLDVLEESGILTFLNGLEDVIQRQDSPLDEVLWIKGAYPLSSATPQQFERLLNRPLRRGS